MRREHLFLPSASIVHPGCTKPLNGEGGVHRGGGKELTGRDAEPSELIYFKVYKSQAPVIEQAIDTAALMLGSDKSRGYCLEMICADFLAGAHIENGNPKILLLSMTRFFRLLPATLRQEFLQQVTEAA